MSTPRMVLTTTGEVCPQASAYPRIFGHRTSSAAEYDRMAGAWEM